MKESSVDCNFFKKNNVIITNKNVKQITSSGKILNINIGDKKKSSMCDYFDDCDYKCNWTPNPKLKYPINNDTFNFNSFGETDKQKCKKIIIEMYRKNNEYHLDNIIDEIRKVYPTMNEEFIMNGLGDFVNNKNEIILNEFDIKGYIIYSGDYYIYQPLDLERTDLPIIYRTNPLSKKPKYVSLEGLKYDYPEKEEINIFNINANIYDEIINKIKLNINIHSEISNKSNKNIELDKNYIEAVIGCILDLLTHKNEHLFIKELLTNYYDDESNQNKKYLKNIIEYYKKNNTFINYYQDIDYEKSKIDLNKFVGFISFNEIYVFNFINKKEKINSINLKKINIQKASEEVKNNILVIRKIHLKNIIKYSNFNIVYGVSEYLKNKNERKFKIIDKTKEEKILTQKLEASKRAQYTGRACSFYQKPELLSLRKKLDLYDLKNKKFKIDVLCNNIEITLRYYQLNKKDNKTWFFFEKI